MKSADQVSEQLHAKSRTWRSVSEPPRFDGTPRVEAVPRPATTSEHLAYWISNLGSPPAVGFVAFAATIARLAMPGLWLWMLLYVLLSLAGPLLFLMWQVRRGHVTDFDLHFRQQRKWSLLVTTLGFALTWLFMLLGRAPAPLLLIVGTGLLQWMAIYLITFRWKISVHSASISGVTLFMLWTFGWIAVPLVLMTLLVGWSRVKLRRHSTAQALAGVALGVAAFAIALVLSSARRTPGLLCP